MVVLLLLLLLLEGLFSPSSPSLLCGRFSPGARAVGAGGGGGGAIVTAAIVVVLRAL